MQILDVNKSRNDCMIDISNNNRVGILLKRNASLLTTIHSCYKNRITYIPIDPNWPEERINPIISTTDITSEEYYGRVNCPKIIVVDEESNIKFSKQCQENEIAYIIYTSGSTGQSKGVEVKYESLLNFIDGISEIIDFSSPKRIACLSAISFDIFFLESIMALEKG